MNISCASNLDDVFIKKISDNINEKKLEFFLSFPSDKFSLNRHFIPNINYVDFKKHIHLIISSWYKVNYLLNSLLINDYDLLIKKISDLTNIWIDTFTVSDLKVIEFLNKKFPQINIVLSIIYWLKYTEDIYKLLKKYSISRFIFDQSLNHNFRGLINLTKECKKNWIETEILVNELCFTDCKYRKQHYNLDSKYSKIDFNLKSKLWDYCNDERKSNNIILDSPWIRPEDIEIYEKIWIDYIKISWRNSWTDVLFNCLDSYINKNYIWNFFDLMDLDWKRDDKTWRSETRYYDNKRLNSVLLSKIKKL